MVIMHQNAVIIVAYILLALCGGLLMFFLFKSLFTV